MYEDIWDGVEYLDDCEYSRQLGELAALVVDIIEADPELRTKKNTTDMFDYKEPEDFRYEEEDEEVY